MTAAAKRRWLSPLRYPGGKARMATFLGDLFEAQTGPMDIEIWMEPFAGGAGAGLALLDSGRVDEVWLVEKNPALAALWRSIIHQGADLAARVSATTPTIALWNEVRAVLAASAAGERFEDLDLAYAAFLINRCSRSGIVAPDVGPIGGKNQTGRWTIASRFNAEALAERIRHITTLGSRLRITEGDAISHVASLTDSGIEEELFLFVDPPYLVEGNGLYAHGMRWPDHQALADALNGCPAPWMLTYDAEPAVFEQLYPDRRVLSYDIPHTANQQRIDREFAVFSDHTFVGPTPELLAKGQSEWVHRPSWASAEAA